MRFQSVRLKSGSWEPVASRASASIRAHSASGHALSANSHSAERCRSGCIFVCGQAADTNHSIEDGNSRRLNEAANILRAFRACQTSFYVNQFCATAGAEAIIASAPGIAAEATHAAVLLAALWSDGLPRAVEAMAKATGSASGGATVAALSRVGASTPRPPAEATEIARATAADVAEQGIFAAELEADGTSLHWAGSTPSPLQGDAKEQTIRLLSMPLWSKGMPAEAQTAWRRLRERTLALESGLKTGSSGTSSAYGAGPPIWLSNESWPENGNANNIKPRPCDGNAPSPSATCQSRDWPS